MEYSDDPYNTHVHDGICQACHPGARPLGPIGNHGDNTLALIVDVDGHYRLILEPGHRDDIVIRFDTNHISGDRSDEYVMRALQHLDPKRTWAVMQIARANGWDDNSSEPVEVWLYRKAAEQSSSAGQAGRQPQ